MIYVQGESIVIWETDVEGLSSSIEKDYVNGNEAIVQISTDDSLKAVTWADENLEFFVAVSNETKSEMMKIAQGLYTK